MSSSFTHLNPNPPHPPHTHVFVVTSVESGSELRVGVRCAAEPVQSIVHWSRGDRLSWLLSESVGILCRFPPVSRRKGSMTSQSDTQWVTASLSLSNNTPLSLPPPLRQTSQLPSHMGRFVLIFENLVTLWSLLIPLPYGRVTAIHPLERFAGTLCLVRCAVLLVASVLVLGHAYSHLNNACLDVCGTLAVSVCMSDCGCSEMNPAENLHDCILMCIQIMFFLVIIHLLSSSWQ